MTPSPVRDWVSHVREAIASDLAVHGLAYLGVLLVFAGALGFFLFSFGTLSHAVRPYAELAIPTVLFGSAWYLRRRGAPVVATAMGLVAGVLLPVVLFASFVDGVAFPPEMQGNALAAAVAVTSLLLAAAYSAVAIKWPDASVRYLVAPMVWTALWGVGLALEPGQVVRLNEWGPWPFALAAIGVTLTAAFVRATARGESLARCVALADPRGAGHAGVGTRARPVAGVAMGADGRRVPRVVGHE